MHEMGIALQIIKIAVDALPQEGTENKISAVNVEIGSLSAIVPENLSFCFEVAAQKTPCAGAKMVIETVPAVMACSDCKKDREITELPFECPDCGSFNIRIQKNTEIDVISIEVED